MKLNIKAFLFLLFVVGVFFFAFDIKTASALTCYDYHYVGYYSSSSACQSYCWGYCNSLGEGYDTWSCSGSYCYCVYQWTCNDECQSCGSTKPTCNNLSGVCGNQLGPSCRYASTCDAWYYKKTCSGGSCSGATTWTSNASNDSSCNGEICEGSGTCACTCDSSGNCQCPSSSTKCSSLQDCDYLNYYYQSPSGDSPTGTEVCYYRDYVDTYQYCNGAGSCASLNCSSYSNNYQYECGTCKYIPSNYCTGSTLGSCANYADGTSCGTNMECDGNGNCVAQEQDTKIDCYFGATNCIFDKEVVPVGESVWACGILRTTGGSAISGKTLSFWVRTDGSYDKVFDVGTTDENGYACKSWSPDSSYQGTRNYILYFAGDGTYNLSQTSEYSLEVLPSADDIDCYNECVRRGYPGGECTYDYLPFPLVTPPCTECLFFNCGGYPLYDHISDLGNCSGLMVGCYCCHNCGSPPSKSFDVGPCSITITPTGWDDTDDVIGGFHWFDKDGYVLTTMDDNLGDTTCDDNLDFITSWASWWGEGTQPEDKFTPELFINKKHADHDLGGGFTLNGGICKYTVSLVDTTESPGNVVGDELGACESGTHTFGMIRDANTGNYLRWLIDMEYCGDGQCNCGETVLTCSTDCVKPDLIITAIRDNNGAVEYTIKNQGGVNAGTSYTKLYVDGVYKESKYENSLSAGISRTQSFNYDWKSNYTAPSDTIKVCADDNNAVAESIETNNCRQEIWELDTTPPTSIILGTDPAGKSAYACDWYKEGTYWVSVEDYDNPGGSGLDTCHYSIYNNATRIRSGTRICNSSNSFSFTVGSTGDCPLQGKNDETDLGQCQIYVRSVDKADPPNWSPWDMENYCVDYEAPTTE